MNVLLKGCGHLRPESQRYQWRLRIDCTRCRGPIQSVYTSRQPVHQLLLDSAKASPRFQSRAGHRHASRLAFFGVRGPKASSGRQPPCIVHFDTEQGPKNVEGSTGRWEKTSAKEERHRDRMDLRWRLHRRQPQPNPPKEGSLQQFQPSVRWRHGPWLCSQCVSSSDLNLDRVHCWTNELPRQSDIHPRRRWTSSPWCRGDWNLSDPPHSIRSNHESKWCTWP